MKGTKGLDKKLLLYSAAVGATCVAGGSADAFVDYYPSGVTGTGINQYLLSFDLAGNVITAPSATPGPSDQFGFWNHQSTRVTGAGKSRRSSFNERLGIQGRQPFAAVLGTSSFARLLSAGQPIGSAGPWASAPLLGARVTTTSGSTYRSGAWRPGTRGYLGLEFDDAGTPVFGWADVRMNAYDSVTLYAYAYEDNGGVIDTGETSDGTTGTIPEPCTLALLAVGAAGLAALRRRQRAA